MNVVYSVAFIYYSQSDIHFQAKSLWEKTKYTTFLCQEQNSVYTIYLLALKKSVGV